MDIYVLVLSSLFLISIVLLITLLLLLWKYSGKIFPKGELPVSKPPRGKVRIRIPVFGSEEETIEKVIRERLEAIKHRDGERLLKLVDRDLYSKFDDWPPYNLQGNDALSREIEAYKVLKEYDYKILDLKIKVLNEYALATLVINYRGLIRNLKFNITSRVSMLLKLQDDKWRLLHEHWSRMSE